VLYAVDEDAVSGLGSRGAYGHRHSSAIRPQPDSFPLFRLLLASPCSILAIPHRLGPVNAVHAHVW
jgi:hypothetical protein